MQIPETHPFLPKNTGWLFRSLFSLLVGILPVLPAFSQTPGAGNSPPASAAATEEAVTVFLDCGSCDHNYIRQEIDFVDYVRDQQLAQVHVFVTDQGTGSGGRTFTFSFLGNGPFEGINNTLTYTSRQTGTYDEVRQGIATLLRLGLVPYVAHTSLAGQLSLTVGKERVESQQPEDRWQNWIFEVYGGGNFEKEASKSSLDIRYGLSADRVTEKWRIRARPYFNYNRRSFVQENKTIRSVLHRNGFEGRVVRSISNHWSVGIFTDLVSSTYGNIGLGLEVAPALEYSLLPYSEAMRREITVAYRAGLLRQRYLEETIYGQMQETLGQQALELSVRLRQPWGSVTTTLEGSHYLHDPGKHRLDFESDVSIRILRGLGLNFSADFEIIRDQVSLPRGSASLEDVLLQQRQLATTYGVSLSAGLSYTFGSMYNNMVNTRL